MENSETQFPLTFAEVLYEELLEQNHDAARAFTDAITRLRKETDWKRREAHCREIVPEIFSAIHELAKGGDANTRSALCLSGGGIRSATFNLGILQGLARHGLLDRFDYLSTVSGGGFIGGWLTAWIRRQGSVSKVAKRLADPPKSPLDPEPEPIKNLRVYSNYLTPNKGLFTADTWTLVAVYLRNLGLNWLVFVPAIMAFLMLPLLWSAVLKSRYVGADLWLDIGWLGAVAALTYIVLGLPSSKALHSNDKSFHIFCLLPLLISAMAFTAYWVRSPRMPSRSAFAILAISLFVIPVLVLLITHLVAWTRRKNEVATEPKVHKGRRLLAGGKYLLAIILILISAVIIGILTFYLLKALPGASELLGQYFDYYAAFALPLFLLMLAFGGTLIAGFTSSFTDVDDQEWWARVGAWMLIASFGWIIMNVLVLMGPSLLDGLWAKLRHPKWEWFSDKGVIATAVGAVSGFVTLVGGSSSKTPAQGETYQQVGKVANIMSLGTTGAATIFAAFLIILLASLNNWIHQLLGGRGIVLVVMMIVLAVTSGIVGRFINTNKFSLHYYWRNRIIRAYLGASRNNRDKTKNQFTDFDKNDNLPMHELARHPLHVINIALNLVGGQRLEWQDRKAESFTVSPLHVGSYWLGYRSAKEYGGDNGISLGTAVAISGAAASPNMGYMMTSPVVRFIMTLFNVRLGFWLGNPGLAGSNTTALRKVLPTFNRDSPRSSVRPIVAEALGQTNEASPYVYLSDGGHFENLGLYEMVLRRCRFIVVSDASTDPQYGFQSLALAIRQIRVDLGVPIEMEKMAFGNMPKESNNYCAVGTIQYSCVDNLAGDKRDNKEFDGTLIYLKPSLMGAEPRDVLNYHSECNNFPEETVADQWFSEAQFESYRILGSHMIDNICGNSRRPLTLGEFAEQARTRIK